MALRRKDPAQIDAVDAEQIQEMLDSPGWQWIKLALEMKQQEKMRDLVRPHTEVQTATLRGEIDALGIAAAMPQVLIAEARKRSPLSNGRR